MKINNPTFSLFIYTILACFGMGWSWSNTKTLHPCRMMVRMSMMSEDNRSCMSDKRRDLLNKFLFTASSSMLVVGRSSSPVWASGGATAGGAYLLSAKQRYNARVTAGVKAYLEIGSEIENGNINPAKAFFGTDQVGGWEDFASAGYLLANAFRRSSSTAPDSLPSVKKWKAFKAVVESLEKKVTKKKGVGAADVWNEGKAALDLYLEEVELPLSSEI